MGAHSPAEKLLKHWLRIASVGSWAAESRAAKLVKRTSAFLMLPKIGNRNAVRECA